MHLIFNLPAFLFRKLSLVGLAFFCIAITQVSATAGATFGHAKYTKMAHKVNQKTNYPVVESTEPLKCTIDLSQPLGNIDHRIFGTNLEWFNDGGGLASNDLNLRKKIAQLAVKQGVSVMRFPGGALSDYYHWRNGIGPIQTRPRSPHSTDTNSSQNNFGSPEYFKFLKETKSEGMITVNVGTGTAQSAADWVAYANSPTHPLRAQDGFKAPIGIKLWEIGNELYFSANPGEKSITHTPEEYAQKYLSFSRAIKAVDPTVSTLAIGIATSHIGPNTPYLDWSERLLKKAGKEIDMIAVHNAYFPMLYHERQPNVKDIYPALMASPEAVDESLITLEGLLKQYEGKHEIGIAITEWGGLFSLPDVDNYWVDHVKTMGTGVYIARMLQVMMSHPRVKLANYFKLTDRSFMGWIDYKGDPKVPFWVFALYANHHGNQRLASHIVSPTYDAPLIGHMKAQKDVDEVTVMASQNTKTNQIYINFVNRSLTTSYPIDLNFINGKVSHNGTLLRIQTKELTAHNGRDQPPEAPYGLQYEPYTTAKPNSINIKEVKWSDKQPIKIAPFSVMTLVLDAQQ
jgi:alpha-N-arabinofuranosidase